MYGDTYKFCSSGKQEKQVNTKVCENNLKTGKCEIVKGKCKRRKNGKPTSIK
jgi:hypothetical protein